MRRWKNITMAPMCCTNSTFRVGASTLEEGMEFAGVLHAARSAAREGSGEKPAFSPPANPPEA